MKERIAYQGHEGAYSHLSCIKTYPDLEPLACSSFIEAMAAAERGQAKLAMIPLENSTAGRVEEIYRLIPKLSLHIIGEHFEPVNHCLMALPGSTLDQLTEIASHPQALAQCAGAISQLATTTRATIDTAGAAEEVMRTGRLNRAAIASSLAAELYGLEILREHFQDVEGNTTRFIVLSHDEHLPEFDPSKMYITSLIFRVRNIPAALYKVLGGFATNAVNLLKLESYMPAGREISSQFHIDIEGHIQEPSVQLAMEELHFFAEEIRILGTFAAHRFRSNSK